MRAFCPGHITGLFTIENECLDPLKRGSRGVGFCVGLGAVSEVEISRGPSMISIKINGQTSKAPVTTSALELLLGDIEVELHADITLQAPTGQGFGMSAAGSFATCLAAAQELDVPEPKAAALRATHTSEVEHRTGLGDAVAQSIGGFVHRLKPGIPPHGVIERPFKGNEEVVVCLLGHPPSTADILNSDMKETITQAGDEQLRRFSEEKNLDMMIASSWAFARDSGLATPPMKEALNAIAGIGQGSTVMLGNAIFAFGDADLLEERLRPYGEVIITKVSGVGASILT